MLNILTEKLFQRGIQELIRRDLDLKMVIDKWGSPPFWTHDDGFPGIVLDILSQQVSLESAKATFTKLERISGVVDPEKFLLLDDKMLKKIGFSRQKMMYVRGVAHSTLKNELNFDELKSLDDDQVRERLISLKGIGGWTANTYLLFALRRSDIWPSGDLALIKAVYDVKDITTVLSEQDIVNVTRKWKPWRSVAARILWHYYLKEHGRDSFL